MGGQIPQTNPPVYRHPTKGFLSLIPQSWVPYAQLMRLEKPAGYFAVYFPHLHGLLFALALSPSAQPCLQQILAHTCIIIGCIILRGAACTWNDTLDAPYDRQVARCRLRPIARGAVTPTAALVFMVVQTIVGVALTLLPLPRASWWPAAALTATQVVYPLCKRFTYYPQVMLGMSFASGLGVGAGAGGIDLVLIMWKLVMGIVSTAITWNIDIPQAWMALGSDERKILGAFSCLFTSIIINTLVYDTIYGHQDLADDIKAGVKGVAVAWRDNTKRICIVLAVFETLLVATAGHIAGLGIGFHISAAGGTAGVLGAMIYHVKLNDPQSCMWCFKWIILGTGFAWTIGLLAAGA
ncbi:UbiA prenyltransferase family [Tricladium varicosporioides]|nr:UbiA prenyltransferase family [Hymenoscyphus varicosporioides]